ncbi:adenylate cyclase [Tamaricihabitans halophyticus]|uniref:Adenylate cyclase n=1 Tax=Tamaricihabitans halophyticus TaxID=1262583 RepID=A0A4R2QJD5_9PSEU|nr:adenylate/guanylate cyclase domain-containing protein [Tamaricihabitans halophyticus]TCP48598.1 adenylate cyclase [Tamaricihabitans halophyticus]
MNPTDSDQLTEQTDQPAAEPEDDAELEIVQRRIERILLGGRRKYTRHQVAERAGVSMERTAQLWRAMGFASTEDDAVLFTDSDVQALRVAEALVQNGILDVSAQVSTARALGQHLARIAEWQVDLLRSAIAANPELAGNDRRLTRFIDQLLPQLEEVQSLVWRRHLAAYAGRALATQDEDLDTRISAVGFVDMVGYTSLTRQSSATELSTVLERFEAVAAGIVADHYGRVVKTLGDEVLFLAGTPRDAAEIALHLVDAAEEDDLLPSLRAGLAYGRVLGRYGDVYGSTVNIASRLTSIARPARVLVDRAFAEALREDSRYVLRPRRPVSVRGFHRLKPAVLRRAQ